MDAFFAFLGTPSGQHLIDALVLFLVAGASYLSFLAKRDATVAAKALDEHLVEHAVEGSTPLGQMPIAENTPKDP